MIEIVYDNEFNFHLDFTQDKDCMDSRTCLNDQLYALVMGWA